MSGPAGNVGNLQDAALKRKEKLQALKERQNKGQSSDRNEDGSNENVEKLPRPVFRSYKPQDENLKESQLPTVKPLEIQEKMKDTLDDAKTEQVIEEVDLGNLAPRKPDWDLKRDVAKRLEKLERRTQRAIAELIRERLQAGQEDLATAVSARPDDSVVEGSHLTTSTTTTAAEADRNFYVDDDDDL